MELNLPAIHVYDYELYVIEYDGAVRPYVPGEPIESSDIHIRAKGNNAVLIVHLKPNDREAMYKSELAYKKAQQSKTDKELRKMYRNTDEYLLTKKITPFELVRLFHTESWKIHHMHHYFEDVKQWFAMYDKRIAFKSLKKKVKLTRWHKHQNQRLRTIALRKELCEEIRYSPRGIMAAFDTHGEDAFGILGY